jgi:protocatechuate 3,4-dioxygenase beta subunit
MNFLHRIWSRLGFSFSKSLRRRGRQIRTVRSKRRFWMDLHRSSLSVESLEARQVMATWLATTDLVYDPTPGSVTSGDEVIVGSIISERLDEASVQVTYSIDAVHRAAYDLASVESSINGGVGGTATNGSLPGDTDAFSHTITMPTGTSLQTIETNATLNLRDISVFNTDLPTMGVVRVFASLFSPKAYFDTQLFTAEIPVNTDVAADTITTPATATSWATGTAVRVVTGFGVGAVPDSTDTTNSTLTFAVAHGLSTGSAVVPAATSGGLTAGVSYFARVISPTVISLYNTAANASAGVSTASTTGLIGLTGPVTSALYGTSTTGLGRSPTSTRNTITTSYFVRNLGGNSYELYDTYANSLGSGSAGRIDILGVLPANGSMVVVGPKESLPFIGQIPLSNAHVPASTDIVADCVTFSVDPNWATGTSVRAAQAIGGLSTATTYFVRNLGGGQYKFYTTVAAATGTGTAVNLTADVTTQIFSGVDTVTFAKPHALQTGDIVRLSASSAGLVVQTAYYARAVDDYSIKLFATQANATANVSALTFTTPITAAIGRTTASWCSDVERDVTIGTEYVGQIWSSYQTADFPFTGTDPRQANTAESGTLISNAALTPSATDITNDTVTFTTTHGLTTGEAISLTTSSNVLTAGTTYYARITSTTAVSLFTSAADAVNNVNRVNLTAAITGTSFYRARWITFPTAPGWIAGSRVAFDTAGAGLSTASSYYLGTVSGLSTKFSLHNTRDDALNGVNAITLTGALPATTKIAIWETLVERPENLDALNYMVNYAPMQRLANGRPAASTTFANGAPVASTLITNSGITPTSTNVTAGIESVTFGADHGFASGDPVRVTATGGGLTVATTYFARALTSTSISFYTSAAAALAGGSTGLVNLTANVTAGVYSAPLSSTQDTVTFAAGHGFVTGDAVTVSATGGGLTAGTTYFLYQVAGDTFSVHTGSPTEVNKVDLTAAITANLSGNAVSVADYDWSNGMAVQVSATGGGLTAGVTYYVRALTPTLLSFYNSASDATGDVNRIDLTAPLTSTIRPFYTTMDQQNTTWELIENNPAVTAASKRDRINELLTTINAVVPLQKASVDYIPPVGGIFVILVRPVEYNAVTGALFSSGQLNLTTMPATAIPGYTKSATAFSQQQPEVFAASLGDFVWEDVNANGQQDLGEPGIPDVTVKLLDRDGNVVGTTTTDATGAYAFTELTPDTYSVQFIAPSGYVATVTDNGDDATDSDPVDGVTGQYTLANAENNISIDAGFYRPAALGDFVWKDLDADGQQDPDEPGIAGVTVRLLDANGSLVASTTSGSDGGYAFSNLHPGSYRVSFVTPQNYFPSPENSGDDASDSDPINGVTSIVTLVSGETNNTIDAGYYQLTALGDFVWEDLNADGVQDADEPGIEDVTVNLLDSQDNVVATTWTDAGGGYWFSGLTPGSYRIQFVAPNGYHASPANAGDDATDSDAVNGLSGTYTLMAGDTDFTVDAGFYRLAALGDFVWDDLDADGQQDSGEPGLADVTVNLLDASDQVLATTTTDSSGAYAFTGLTPGSYKVQFVQPTGFTPTTANHEDDSTDSDAVDGVTGAYTLASGEVNNTIDAGFFGCGLIGDFVWEDLNANGQQDAGEPGIDGVTVNLYDSNGNLLGTRTTHDGGTYHFTALRPGTYQVEFVAPTGYVASPATVGDSGSDSNAVNGRSGDITLVSCQQDHTIDAGFYQFAALGDFVWHDLNANGQQDSDEPGIADVTVTLLDGSGNVAGTTTTNSSGAYSFTGLVPGSYSVQFTTPSGYVATTADAGSDASDSDAVDGLSGAYTLASGETNNTIDAGYYQLAALGDFVWHDLNANGQQDSDEPGIADVTVTLLDGSGNVAGTTTTSSSGAYSFTGLVPGSYSVQFTTPSGYVATTADAGSDASDSDAVGGVTGSYTLASGETNNTIDAGYYQLASLGDFVWHDLNINGQQDSGEPGIADVTVTLLDGSGNVAGTTTTSSSGAYSFTGLLPGSYSVQFTTPSGYVATTANSGADASDSDAVGGVTGSYTLASGETNNTIDAGFYQLASLGDFVWHDLNANGQQDSGEPGIADVTVTLLDGSGNVAGTTTTSSSGAYAFTGLLPGSYSVQFTTPSGYVATTADSGSDASDSDAVGGATGSYTLASGETNNTIDAGFYQLASLGDFVWHDLNANGQQDSDEPGISGVTVTLLDGSGNVAGTTTTSSSGAYAFTGLLPGSYSVQFTTPSGYVATTANAGADASDSDAVSGVTGSYTLASGETNNTIDAGFYQTAALGDLVWNDANKNGQQDSGESGISGVTVTLLSSSGSVVSTTTTSSSGAYSFTGLVPGSYSVRFTTPSGYVATSANLGNDATDSDAVSGVTGSYTLVSGQTNNTVDAGYYQSANPAGLTIGFWSNKNGAAIISATGAQSGNLKADVFNLLKPLNLRNANGTPLIKSTDTALATTTFQKWLTGAKASNMANMLSAQLAGTVLNLYAGFVNSDWSIDFNKVTVVGSSTKLSTAMLSQLNANGLGTSANQSAKLGDIVTKARDVLATKSITTASGNDRTYQEALKNIFDAVNNNQKIFIF